MEDVGFSGREDGDGGGGGGSEGFDVALGQAGEPLDHADEVVAGLGGVGSHRLEAEEGVVEEHEHAVESLLGLPVAVLREDGLVADGRLGLQEQRALAAKVVVVDDAADGRDFGEAWLVGGDVAGLAVVAEEFP